MVKCTIQADASKEICQAVMYRIQEKLVNIVSNGEKSSFPSANRPRRGGTARSFGDGSQGTNASFEDQIQSKVSRIHSLAS